MDTSGGFCKPTKPPRGAKSTKEHPLSCEDMVCTRDLPELRSKLTHCQLFTDLARHLCASTRPLCVWQVRAPRRSGKAVRYRSIPRPRSRRRGPTFIGLGSRSGESTTALTHGRQPIITAPSTIGSCPCETPRTDKRGDAQSLTAFGLHAVANPSRSVAPEELQFVVEQGCDGDDAPLLQDGVVPNLTRRLATTASSGATAGKLLAGMRSTSILRI